MRGVDFMREMRFYPSVTSARAQEPLAPSGTICSPHLLDGIRGDKGGIYEPNALRKSKGFPHFLLESAGCHPSSSPPHPAYKAASCPTQPHFGIAMCTGACSRVLGAALWPFALLCIVCNIILAFPDWKTQYVHHWGEYLTPEILYLGGIIGGGVMVSKRELLLAVIGTLYGLCNRRNNLAEETWGGGAMQKPGSYSPPPPLFNSLGHKDPGQFLLLGCFHFACKLL
ncbi:uncharacterized protein LOC117058817 [Lacerta agilis]|uniref:uncharacterized protein LOC117058817 n=1 Tax=Lacerta agilis TaxID=80427 RepID=UPI00141A2A33|nr:uncharacterized protein LOC117058817 [Lacerta agilis]